MTGNSGVLHAPRMRALLERLAAGQGASEGDDVGRLASLALTDPGKLSRGEIARLADAMARWSGADPGSGTGDAGASTRPEAPDP